MTYVLLNEETQTISYPPINKDNICNYNIATDLLVADGYVDISDDLIALFNGGKGKIENGTIVDVSATDDYKTKIAAQEKAVKTADLNAQIDAIDKKRIRAIAEPSVKDETSGETWLEYYTEQIVALRAEITALDTTTSTTSTTSTTDNTSS